jgi:hypothetical protein
VLSDAAVDDDAWHHAALIADLDSDTATLFVDGALADEQTLLLPTPGGAAFHVGARRGVTDYFTGLIDEVRIGPPRPADYFAAVFAGTALATVGAEELYSQLTPPGATHSGIVITSK